MQNTIKHALLTAINNIKQTTIIPNVSIAKNNSRGDFSTNVALVCAKSFNMPAYDLAQKICSMLDIQNVQYDISEKGFINFAVINNKNVFLFDIIGNTSYGTLPSNNKTVVIEFVSANPTGPLHIGHARQGIIGDVLANVYKHQGWNVVKEYYYNDAGKQIDNLGQSVMACIQQTEWQEHYYNGEYIKDIAAAYNGDIDIDSVTKYAVDVLTAEQASDLKKFGIQFNKYSLESAMFPDKVNNLISVWNNNDLTYTHENATWFKSTLFGDDKDRVVITKDGNHTYFVPDVAYHVEKLSRCDKAINIQGSDHHGTIARVKAGLSGYGVDNVDEKLHYILHKMVTVVKNNEIVKISKRAGSYITLSDLIDMTSKDAVRFTLVSKSPETEFTFDVDVAVATNNENPLYYVQYAHARISSVISKYNGSMIHDANLDLLDDTASKDMILILQKYGNVLNEVIKTNKPHLLITYVKELAAQYHHYYGQVKILSDDEEKTKANIVLIMAVQQIIRNILGLIGVDAPHEM